MSIYRSLKLKEVALIGLIALMYISISMTLITLLLGFLLIPPIAVFAYVCIQGVPLLKMEMKDLLASGKDFFLISVSRENIILEPQFR